MGIFSTKKNEDNTHTRTNFYFHFFICQWVGPMMYLPTQGLNMKFPCIFAV